MLVWRLGWGHVLVWRVGWGHVLVWRLGWGRCMQTAVLVVDEDRMMLCTDIGVLEYDLVAQEVRDTWKLEFGGIALSVRSVARSGGLWWAATSSGLWTAPVGSPFPGNPATWSPAGLDGANLMDLLSLESGGLVALERREGPREVARRVREGILGVARGCLPDTTAEVSA